MYGTQVSMGLLSLANVFIMARAIGPVGRGDVVFLMTITNLTGQFCTFGVDQAISNFSGRDAAVRPALATNAVIIGILFSAIGAVVVAMLFQVVPGIAGELSTRDRTLALIAIPIPLLTTYLGWLVQAEYAFGISNFANLSASLVTLLVNGAFVALGILTVLSAFLVWVAGQLLAVVVLVGFIVARLSGFGRPNLALARRMIGFGARAQGGRTFMFANYKMGHWFVGAQAGSRELGYYSVAVTWMETLYYLPTVLSAVLRPDLVREGEGAAARRTGAAFRVAAIATGAGAVGMIIAAPVLCVTFFGEDFAGAVDDLRVLVLGTVGVVALRLLGSALTAQGRPLRESAGLSIAMVTILALNIALVPAFGGIGAAWASTIGFTVGAIGMAFLFVRGLDAHVRDLVPGWRDATLLFTGLRRTARGAVMRVRPGRTSTG
jgi:O-antigen/teichoic acid export membrane protein